VFDNGGGQVIVCDFARHPTQHVKRVSVAAGEGPEALAVCELDVERSAVGIDQREGIEFARIAGVTESAEMTPVDFEALSDRWFHPDECAFGGLGPRTAHVFADYAVASLISQGAELLFDDSGTDARVFLQPFLYVAFERIEFARAVPAQGILCGRIEIFPDRLPSDVELALDFADRPAFGPVKAVQFIDLIGSQHCLVPLFMRQDLRLNQQDVVCKMTPAAPGEVEALELQRPASELSCC